MAPNVRAQCPGMGCCGTRGERRTDALTQTLPVSDCASDRLRGFEQGRPESGCGMGKESKMTARAPSTKCPDPAGELVTAFTAHVSEWVSFAALQEWGTAKASHHSKSVCPRGTKYRSSMFALVASGVQSQTCESGWLPRSREGLGGSTSNLPLRSCAPEATG